RVTEATLGYILLSAATVSAPRILALARAGSADRRSGAPPPRAGDCAPARSSGVGGTRLARRAGAPTSTGPWRARRACGPRAPVELYRLRPQAPRTRLAAVARA